MIRRALWLPLLWLFMAPLLVDAATYYVSPSGNDSAKGSRLAPFRTVKRGITALKASDTLILRAGTYAEGDLTPPSGVPGAPTTIRAEAGSGRCSSPITRPLTRSSSLPRAGAISRLTGSSSMAAVPAASASPSFPSPRKGATAT